MLGNAYSSLNEFEKAIECHQQALGIAKEVGKKDSEGAAYTNLGNAFHRISDFKTAIEFHQKALSIAKEIGQEDSKGAAYTYLGNAYHSLSDFKTALEFCEKALSLAENTGNKESEGGAYFNLGSAFLSQRNFQKAIEKFQQALDIATETGNKDLENFAYANLANAHFCLGVFETALEYYQKVLKYFKETGNKYSMAIAHHNLGSVYSSFGEFKKGITHIQEALNIAEDYKNKPLAEMAYLVLGRNFSELGDLPKAERFCESSIKLFEEMRFLLHDKDELKIIFRNKRSAYALLWNVQLLQGKTVEALVTAERGRAQALVDLLESQYGVKSTQQEEGMKRISDMSSYISSITMFIAEDHKDVNLWVLRKGNKWHFMGTKKIDLTLECLTDKAYKKIGATGLAKCEDRSFRDSEDETTEKLPDRGTDEKELTSSENDCDPIKALYDVVIYPISHLIDDNELIIVPDGSSFLIPYAALLDQNSRYLSETLRIRLAPSLTSLRLLAECPEGRHSTTRALLVGNPWTETVRIKGEKIPQLPGAEEEVKMIGEILNVEPLIGKNATKDQVLRKLNSVSLVHIAAHGSVERGEILLSPNHGSSKRPKEEDFLLTMTDVLNAKLDAKLIVLSCCHSGRGKITAEGVVGIARAFLGAGARSVIASLWAIDDKATLAFMRHFYKHLVKGQTASKSLHEAMKMMRESDDFNAVKYWAPFMLIGDDITLNFEQ